MNKKNFLKNLAIFFGKLGVLPDRLKTKTKAWERVNQINKKIWNWRGLKWVEDGYWKLTPTPTDAEGQYDLIYGSHSLEHVTNVTEFFNHVERLLSPSGVIYFEVPNCHADNPQSYPNGKIHIPHTYYFTRNFFDTLPYNTTLNSTYLVDKYKSKFTSLHGESGHVMRFSGHKKNQEKKLNNILVLLKCINRSFFCAHSR
ncbi:methyltransferase domain-containing protein [Synechocystis sp. LKSZ1]|uniref:class I SAM-dependent methyltransferase n=1 Tax=Synechocystis sp. LKSZ1 TaxID=3144951 RepID=UPI00336BC038